MSYVMPPTCPALIVYHYNNCCSFQAKLLTLSALHMAVTSNEHIVGPPVL